MLTMPPLIPTPDGRWAEDAPTDCENCSLAWPWDGTPDRVLQGWSPEGGRWFQCMGCGHTTGAPDTYRIGHAPDEGRAMKLTPPAAAADTPER